MLYVPAIIWITPRYGAIGVASVWVALNIGYVLIAIYFMHQRLLIGEKWQWYLNDILIPSISAVSVVAVLWLIHPDAMPKIAEAIWLLATGGLALIVSAFSAKELRLQILYYIKMFYLGFNKS